MVFTPTGPLNQQDAKITGLIVIIITLMSAIKCAFLKDKINLSDNVFVR